MLTHSTEPIMRLTMVTFNGITRFMSLPVSADGKVRIPVSVLRSVFGVRRGDCICIR